MSLSIGCPVGWSFQIRRLERGKNLPPYDDCPGNDTKQSDAVVLGNAVYPFIDFALRSTLAQSGSTR